MPRRGDDWDGTHSCGRWRPTCRSTRSTSPVVEQLEEEPGRVPIVASLFDGGSIPLVVGELEQAGAVDVQSTDSRHLGGTARVVFTAHGAGGRRPGQPAARRAVAGAGAADEGGRRQRLPLHPGRDQRHRHRLGPRPARRGPDHRRCWRAGPRTSATASSRTPPRTPRGRATGRWSASATRASVRTPPSWPGAPSVTSAATQVPTPIAAAHGPPELAAGSAGNATLLAELTANMNAGAFVHTNSWHDDRHGAGVAAPYNQVAVDTDTFLRTNEDHVRAGVLRQQRRGAGAAGHGQERTLRVRRRRRRHPDRRRQPGPDRGRPPQARHRRGRV